MSAGGRRRQLWLTSAVGLSSLVTLASCASFGGNVRGDFSCAAPDGICAPSSTIDDRALAIISADPSETDATPARIERSGGKGGNHVAAAQPVRLASVDPARTREKVLRIVFQPFIDERGRLHEASAVHAVVATGEWQQALTQGSPATARTAAIAGVPDSLADILDRADPPLGIRAIDPAAPNPAVVAAARARKPDPVSAIKADVAARLAPKAAGTTGLPDGAVRPPSAAVSSASPASPSKRTSGSTPSSQGAASEKPSVAAAGAQAIDRVKADPAYQGAASNIAKGARDAAGASGALPSGPSSTVRAASFPAAVPEDK